MKKVYIYRVINHNNRKEYKRTKCLNYWTDRKEVCWKFSIQGAKRIVNKYESNKRTNYYSFGIEIIEGN